MGRAARRHQPHPGGGGARTRPRRRRRSLDPRVEVTVDGAPVEVPAHIGVDRLRAVQAPVHTHEAGGEVWLEGEGNRDTTLGQFFTLWGVRFDEDCLGAACGGVTVLADGERVDDPAALILRGNQLVEVSVG